MSEFTRENIKTLEQDIQKALKTVEKKHSVTFKISGDSRFGAYDYGYTIKATKESPYRQNYLNRASEFGLEPTWLDKWFSSQIGRTGWGGFVVVGLDPANRYPVVCNRVKDSVLSGSLYFFPVETVKKGVTDHLAMLAEIEVDKQAKATAVAQA